ncbi:hypothetical protein KW823_26255, partial [Enterobacter quasiroggenkampii]|nr:hypothetical protein [Enterobacter quasiroggenkampii]
FFLDLIPYFNFANEYAEMGFVPVGSYNNRAYLDGKYELKNVETWMVDILFDPQTSGGLLISASKEEGDIIMERLKTLDLPCAIIGEVIEKGEKYIVVE